MKHAIIYILVGIIVCAPPTYASAATNPGLDCSSGTCAYTPLEPLPCPGGAFDCQSGATDFVGLIQTVFRILFSLAGLLAVAMLVVGGIQYMLSEIPAVKASALGRAQAAVYGILILAGSWLILNTINPQLLQFNFGLDGSLPAHTSISGESLDSDQVGYESGDGKINTIRVDESSQNKAQQINDFNAKCVAAGGSFKTLLTVKDSYTLYTCVKTGS